MMSLARSQRFAARLIRTPIRPAAPFRRGLTTDSEDNFVGSDTHKNLKDAFAGESMANRRYLYWATKADIEGNTEAAALFRSTADGTPRVRAHSEGETGHAHGHLHFLELYGAGDPPTDMPTGDTEKNLKAAITGETHEYQDMYPGYAKTARDEGFEDVADWFETLAMAEKSHAGKFQKALKNLAQ